MNETLKIKKANEYIKNNIWKQFFKLKFYELILIPLGLLILWKVPLWIGWGFIKMFNIDPATNTLLCLDKNYGIIGSPIICSGINTVMVWWFGLLCLVLPILFIMLNWCWAKLLVLDEAKDKYNISDEEDLQ